MSSELRLRRGTDTQHNSFTGAEAEVTVNTTNKSVHVHDGTTTGGFELARADLNNVENAVFAAKAAAAGISGGGDFISTITGVTKASPAVVTVSSSHGYIDGQQVTISGVGGMTQLNGNTYYADVLTSTTFALYSDIALTTPINSTAYTTYTSGGEVAGSVSAGAPISGSYVTINTEAGMPNERRLQAGSGLTLTDGGAGGAVTMAANLASTSPANLGSASAGASTAVARADHVHAMPTATDVGAVPTSRQVLAGTGLSGGGALSSNVTLSLNANLNNLTDVVINGTPANGDVLMYNEAISQFENSSTFGKNTILLNNANVAVNTINKLNFIGTGLTAQVNGSDSSRVDITVTTSNTTDVQTIVGGMVSGNTENGIAVTFDAVGGKLNFDVNDPTITLTGDVTGAGTMTNLGSFSIETTIAANSVQLGTDTQGNYVATVSGSKGISVSGSGSENASVAITIDETNADYIKNVQNIIGTMVTGNTENGISVIYDIASGKLNFQTASPVITLSGAVTGTGTLTNLSGTTITTSIAADAITLGTQTTGNYVATVSGTGGITISGSGVENASVVVGLDANSPTFIEAVQDAVVPMLDGNTENGISVTYNDDTNKINFDVSDPWISISGAVTGQQQMLNLTNTTITVTQAVDSVTLGTHTVGNYIATIAPNTTTGFGGIVVNGSGSETAAATIGINYSNGDFIEAVQDIVYVMVDSNTENGISVTYDDNTNKLNFDVNDPLITISGAVTGSQTMTNLSNTTINVTQADNSVTLGQHTVGAYVANITGTQGITVSANNVETAAVTLGLDTTNADFRNAVRDFVAPMFATGNGLTITYTDTTTGGNIVINPNDPLITISGAMSGSQRMTDLGDVTINVVPVNDSITLGTHTQGNYVATITANSNIISSGILVTNSGTENANVVIGIDSTNTNFRNIIQDIARGIFPSGASNGITYTYNDTTNVLTLDPNDPVVTLSGVITGSSTMTNLGSITINTALTDNSVTLGQHTVGAYVANITGTQGITVSSNNVETAAVTLGIDRFNADFRDIIEDIASGMFATTHNGLTATYDDTAGTVVLNVNDPVITITGSVSGSQTMSNLNNVTIDVTPVANAIILGTHTSGEYVANISASTAIGASGISVTNSGTESAGVVLGIDSANADFRNTIRDIARGILPDGLSNGITYTYNDSTNTMTIDPSDPLIQLTGAVFGSQRMTNLGDVSIELTQSNNSVTLGQHTVGNYVANIVAGNAIVVTGSGVETADVTIAVDTTSARFVDGVNDAVKNLVSTGSVESGINVEFNFNTQKLEFNVNDPIITLTGDVSGSIQMVDLGDVTITCTVVDNSHNHTIDNIAGLQAALDSKLGGVGGAVTGTLTTQTVVPTTNAAFDLGSVSARYLNVYAQNFQGTAVRANYADLAERYHADAKYPIGSVVKLGGSKEITATTTENDAQVIGVISENPAYLMNDGAGDPNEWLPVAMTGRVRVKIVGPVTKGQRIVSSNEPGVAKAVNDNEITSIMTVIGRALRSDSNPNIKLVECIIGKL